MSRVIKFRAFDGEKMQKVYSMHSNGIAALGDGGMVIDPKMIMQFTGLHDVNGVEIYEGDIVECDEHFYYEISWSEKYHSWHASECGGFVDLPSEIRVIGNIYEQPHLLEVGK